MSSAHGPLFRSVATGAESRSPLELLPPGTPRFSLDKLAFNFDNPFLDSEFPPPCPWDGIERVDRPAPHHRPGSSDIAELGERFTAAVRRAIGDSDVVAVMYSGGLDSSSVLVAADRICRDEGRRLLAVVWNLPDQLGVPTAQVAHRQLRALDIDCDVHVLPVQWRDLPEPEWSPEGIRLDFYTRLHRAMVELALDAGAGVLLTGMGGDEVLAAWNFLTPDLLAARRWSDLRTYWRGFRQDGSMTDLLGEVASVVARNRPGLRSFELYLAFAQETKILPEPFLTPHYREIVAEQHARWRRDRLAEFVARRQSWAAAAVWDSVYPVAYAAHPVGVPLPQASPFLDEEFIDYVLALPLHERFGRADMPYHMYKRLHFRLLPESFVSAAPRYKQGYRQIFRDYVTDVGRDGPLLVEELGLVRRIDRRDLDRIHPRLPAALHNVESWVRGAVAYGAEPC